MPILNKPTGLEISAQGAAFALMGGTKSAPRVERVGRRPFKPDTLQVSLREPNIADPQGFCDKIREAHAPLLAKANRVTVTVPDGVGRTLLVDMDTRFRNRNEGLDMIRWKLKKNLPFDPADTHLDYQQLRVRETGEVALLVTVVSRRVMEQYEECIVAAGLLPAAIELHFFSLCRAFDSRLRSLDDYAVVSLYDNSLGIIAVADGVPEFIRTKELPPGAPFDRRMLMDIDSSLLIYKEKFPERPLRNLLCIAPPERAADFRAMVAEAAGMDAVLLEAKSAIAPGDGAPADQAVLFPYTAAIGAAMRGL